MLLNYRQQKLHFGDFDLSSMTRDYQGPVYIYDLEGIKKRMVFYQQALGKKARIHYAMKANPNLEILRALRGLGAGLDVVSGGEIERGLQAGFAGSDMIFSGVGKTTEEIRMALQQKVHQINVESIQELERIGILAEKAKVKAPIVFRMNPNVNPETHPYITTGFRENKFGLDEQDLPTLLKEIKQNSYLDLKGLSMHIGSQITALESFQEAVQKTKEMLRKVEGEGFQLSRFDVGGGVGIDYENRDLNQEESFLKNYGTMVQKELADLNVEIQCEPGRWIVGHHGILFCQIQYVKKTPYKNFIIVDTGMNHLLRPALYEAEHAIYKQDGSGTEKEKYDIVGPICESADFLSLGTELQICKSGDFVVVADCGAYGMSMASSYNLRKMPHEYFLESRL